LISDSFFYSGETLDLRSREFITSNILIPVFLHPPTASDLADSTIVVICGMSTNGHATGNNFFAIQFARIYFIRAPTKH